MSFALVDYQLLFSTKNTFEKALYFIIDSKLQAVFLQAGFLMCIYKFYVPNITNFIRQLLLLLL
jgi:hypothetical protein